MKEQDKVDDALDIMLNKETVTTYKLSKVKNNLNILLKNDLEPAINGYLL